MDIEEAIHLVTVENNKISISKAHKHPEVINFLKTFYSDSTSARETIYRYTHNITLRPTCLQCR